jgi:uncharacterized membrane-anchored protein
MVFPKLVLFTGCVLTLALALAQGQNGNTTTNTGMIKGPGKARLDDVAELAVPAGYVFIDGKGTRALLKSKGEPTSGQEVGLLISTNEGWSVFFEFSEIGYVKDDDKDKLDADKLLESIKRSNSEANKERQKAGNSPLEIVGWEVPPKYDSTTHNLEWAIRATTEGRPLLNYNTRLLGRTGVMEAVLVCDPEELSKTLPVFRELLTGYSFGSGQTYAEFKQGDKVAKVGLAALVLGGAAVGAAKLGLFAYLAVFFKKAWKLIVVAVAVLAASVKKLFGKLFGNKSGSGTNY